MARRRRKRAHGLGCVYERSPGNWWIKWREGGRVRYAHGYESRELAERVRAKIVAHIAAGRAGLPPDPTDTPTLAELAEHWLKRREATHRAAQDDRQRWRDHLKPFVGTCRPNEVDHALLRRFTEAKLDAGLNSATVRLCMALLSTFYTDLVERGLASANPVKTLPRTTRRLLRPTTDPRSTPFLEHLTDVKRVYAALSSTVSVAFAVGALAGLRTGELLGLQWSDVDLRHRRILVRRQVSEGRLAPLKDDESRVVPILKALAPILAAWKLKTGGEGLLFRPAAPKRGGTERQPPTFLRPHTLHRHFREALEETGLPHLTWYQGTRHTFASHWVLGGGSIEKLAKVLGHSSVLVTGRYAHLKPDLFRETDFELLDVDLEAEGEVIPLKNGAADGTTGYDMVTQG